MKDTKASGIPRLVAAWRNSWAGLRDIWRNEEAFRIEAVLFVLSIPAAAFLCSSIGQFALLTGSLLLLMIVEILNSAIEAAIDRIGPERHELSRIAKDLGSLAVLLAMVLAGIVWAGAIWDAVFA